MPNTLRATPRTTLVVFLFALLPLAASAQPLADRLPGSTLVYLGWSPAASLQTTAAAKMLADERFTGPWRRLLQELVFDAPRGGGPDVALAEHLPQLLADAAQCEGAFALLQLKQQQGRLNPQSVLMLDLGARRKSFEEHFKPLHARMKERVGERLQMMKLTNSWVWTKPDKDGKSQITWGFVGDTFVLFLGDGAEDFIPKLVKGQLDSNLKSAPAFVDALAKVSGDSVFTTYLDAKGGLEVVRRLAELEGNNDFQFLVKNWDKLVAELGLANVKAVAEKTAVEDRQFVTRSLVRTEGPPTGLLAQLAQPAVDDAMLKAIPQDAMAVAAFRQDLGKGYDQLKSSMTNLGGDAAKEAFKELEQGSEGLGLPIKQLLEPLGDQWIVYNATSQGGYAFLGWTLVANVKDVEKFQANLRTVRGMLAQALGGGRDRGQVHSLDVDGAKVEYLSLGHWSAPFSPAWSLVGDKFVLALYPQLVEDAARHITQGGKSLLDNPDYAAARKRTGGAGSLVYMNGPEVAKNLYPSGLVLVHFINSFGGGFGEDEKTTSPDILPSLQRLLQYVGHDAVDLRVTPDGLLKTRTVTNPLLSPLAWVDSPILWIALGIPAMTVVEDGVLGEEPKKDPAQAVPQQ